MSVIYLLLGANLGWAHHGSDGMGSIPVEEEAEEGEAPKAEAPKAEEPKKEEPKKAKKEKQASPPPAASASGESSVLNNGTDEGLSLARAAAAAKRDIAELKSVTMADLQRKPTVLLAGGKAVPCERSQVTMSNLRRRIEQAENKVAYLELEEAINDLNNVADSLPCLVDDVDHEEVGQLYYLRGIVLDALGKSDEAQKSFELAVTFQPSMRWDDYYPPDSKALFEEAKKVAASRSQIPLRMTPKPPVGSLIIDGADLGTEVSLSPGEHLIQIKDLMTTRVIVSDGTKEVTLVVPSAMPQDALAWVHDDAMRGELGNFLNGVIPRGEVAFVADAGEIWQLTAGYDNWEQLEIPKRIIAPGTSPKYVASRALLWGGSSTFLVSGVFAAIKYAEAATSRQTAQNTNVYTDYDESEKEFIKSRSQYQVAIGVSVGGVLFAGGGYALGLNL
jgi:tetratricopeptide (TPR) repeat protein